MHPTKDADAHTLTISYKESWQKPVAVFWSTAFLASLILYLTGSLSFHEPVSAHQVLYIFFDVMWLAAALFLTFRFPYAVVLDMRTRTITRAYLSPDLAPKNGTSHYSDWVAVQTSLEYQYDDEHGTHADAVLLLRSADGGFMELDRKSTVRVPERPFYLSPPDHMEPDDISDLRRRIALFTGLKDLGFSKKAPGDASWNNIGPIN